MYVYALCTLYNVSNVNPSVRVPIGVIGVGISYGPLEAFLKTATTPGFTGVAYMYDTYVIADTTQGSIYPLNNGLPMLPTQHYNSLIAASASEVNTMIAINLTSSTFVYNGDRVYVQWLQFTYYGKTITAVVAIPWDDYDQSTDFIYIYSVYVGIAVVGFTVIVFALFNVAMAMYKRWRGEMAGRIAERQNVASEVDFSMWEK